MSSPALVQEVPTGAFAPLRIAIFRAIWLANLVSLIGTWAQEAGGPWLMSMLTTHKALVASVTGMGSFAICVCSISAGILADILDRRRLLVATQIFMFAVAGSMALLYFAGPLNEHRPFAQSYGPAILLALTFLLYIGAALSGPAFQYVVPELVPAAQMPLAIGLNSVALNLARAIGPIVGMILTQINPGACFLFNAVSFLAVAWVLWRWKGHHQPENPRKENFSQAFRAGVRYTLHSAPLRSILVRVFAFIICASALWGLLQPYAGSVLGIDKQHPQWFGLIMGFLGVGAVVGAVVMPALQRKLSTDPMVALCTLMFMLGMLGLALIHYYWIDCLLMAFVGVNWVIIPTSFNVCTQRSVPVWVKGRAIAMYWTVLWGSMAGAAFWGWVSDQLDVPHALLIASGGLAAGLFLVKRFPLTSGMGQNMAPARRWTLPALDSDPQTDGHPVMVAIEYSVPPERLEEFSQIMRDIRHQRFRDGAMQWSLLDSPHQPGRFVEMFMIKSWLDHQRQFERMTGADALLEERAMSMHDGGRPPALSHWLGLAKISGDGWFGSFQRLSRRLRGEPVRPVFVQVEYRVTDRARAAGLAQTMQGRRNGARQWSIFESVREPGRVVENFIVDAFDESPVAAPGALGFMIDGYQPIVMQWEFAHRRHETGALMKSVIQEARRMWKRMSS